MNITYLNGSSEQHEVIERAISSLLHLDLDRFTFDVEVEFVDDPDPSVHNEFAYTDNDTAPPLIQFRTDFPAFAPLSLWGSIGFANETVIHEVGHAILGQLPTEVLDQVLALFGATQDDLLDDPGKAWEDRLREGVVETFKDAFLPNHLRAYSNRTNVKLPISKYADFRSIFRQEMGGSGETVDYASIENYVYPQYDESFPAGVVLLWNTIGGWPPEATGDPWHPYAPDFINPYVPIGWSNPISVPAGRTDWEITFPYEGSGQGLFNILGGGTPSHSGVSFIIEMVSSRNDNVDSITFFPKPGWVCHYDISVESFFDKPSDPDVLTGVAMEFFGWYAEGEDDLTDTWPDSPQFDGFPKAIYTYWEVAPGESYDPSGSLGAFETVEFVAPELWPGNVTVPFKTPPLPGYVGYSMSYDIEGSFYVALPPFYGMIVEGGTPVAAEAPIEPGEVVPQGRRGGSAPTQQKVTGGRR